MLHQCGAARGEWWKAVFRKSSKAARGLPLVSLLRALWLLSQHDASTQRHKACTISHQMVRWHRPSTRALASDRALFFTSPGFGSLFVLSTQVQLSVRLNKQLRHPHCVPPKPDAHREPRHITSQMYCLLRASLCLSHTHMNTHTHTQQLVPENAADSPLFLADCSAFSFCFLKVKRKQFPVAHPLSLSVMLSNQTKLQLCKQTQINSQSYAWTEDTARITTILPSGVCVWVCVFSFRHQG